jgi:hypothetical protein
MSGTEVAGPDDGEPRIHVERLASQEEQGA